MAITHPVGPGYRAEPAFSVPAILAIICALASFFFGAGVGLMLAVLAIILGGIGVVAALAPGVRGGVTSMLSIIAGVIGIVAAVIKLIF